MSFSQESPVISSSSSHRSLFHDGNKGKSALTRSAAVKTNLYKRLDKLEASLGAEFEKQAAETLGCSFGAYHRGAPAEDSAAGGNDNDLSDEEEAILRNLEQVPFVGDTRPPFGSGSIRGLSDVSAHSDREILGDLLDKEVDEYEWIPNQDQVDEKYSVSPLINHPSGNHHHHRAVSPGQYFAARSLPLDSLDALFNKSKGHRHSTSQETSNTDADPLSLYFKALPASLSHHHRRCERGPTCTVEPRRIVLQTASELPGHAQLRITSSVDQTFSLFSARGKLRFLPREGAVPSSGHVDVMIRLRRSTVHGISKRGGGAREHSTDTILLLVDDGRHIQRIPVEIRHSTQDGEDQHQQGPADADSHVSNGQPGVHVPECPFCALEGGCFLPK